MRGKLLTIPKPKTVLMTPGRVSRDFASLENEEGWSIVRRMQGRARVDQVGPVVPYRS